MRCHLPVLFYLGINDAALNGAKAPILMVALAFAVTLGLSILSLYLLEVPIEQGAVRPPHATWSDAAQGSLIAASFTY